LKRLETLPTRYDDAGPFRETPPTRYDDAEPPREAPAASYYAFGF
jgi:hypothetical protein